MLGSLDLSHGDESGTGLANGISDQLSGLGFSLSSQNGSFSFFFTLEDDKFGTLGSLLGDLLGFNSASEITRELEVSDGNIIEDDVEFKGAFGKDFSDLLRNFLSLRDELLGVVLGDDRLEHFVGDGGQNSLVVVVSDVVEDLGQLVLKRTEQNTKSDVNSLHVLGTRRRGHEGGARADLEAVDLVQDGHTEVHAFTVHV